MKLEEVKNRLEANDRKKKCVYTTAELKTLFETCNAQTYSKTVHVAINAGLLDRVQRGLFVYAQTKIPLFFVSLDIIRAFRPDAYDSLESALSKWSVISQIPFRLTMMTNGRSALIDSDKYGTYEFIHTDRNIAELIKNKDIIVYKNDVNLAKPWTALRDLRRVGRHLELVNMEDYEEALEDVARMKHECDAAGIDF